MEKFMQIEQSGENKLNYFFDKSKLTGYKVVHIFKSRIGNKPTYSLMIILNEGSETLDISGADLLNDLTKKLDKILKENFANKNKS